MTTFYQYSPQQPSSSGPYGNNGAYPYGGNPSGNNPSTNPRGFPQQIPGGEMLGLQNVSPEVLNFGINAGQNILKQQTDRWMPGVSNFWLSLKYYFSVSNSYVLKKMLVVLYPLSNTVWNRLSADEFDRNETDAMIASRKWALPKQDINAPDLYIPLMSFVTYVLLYGFLRGISSPESAANSFSPDILAQSIWRCLILQLLEAGGLKFGANILSIHVPFLDCYAIAGYKYVALCVNTLARFLNGTLAVIVSFYTAIMLAYFALKTTAIAIPPPPSSDGSNSNAPSPRLIVILGFGVAQLLLTLFMSLF